ncbi:TetR family transcriptional regulator [Burkholderia sp. WAC0059]|uniref:TetR/AcrR family transcriptional regulator n=1 Tax=Burkholderia sp. WAC0059 TaxID=2066022 RepID=UPI000C7EABBF|nr:TetR/AcrR family transcriptional regulator [Burkholderia sp. WAC0059]PLZ01944.1 TetR family transcriptional regulator [Burkholderia sp. WAC0059]
MAQMGRPRTFDRDAAVTKAMHLFWEYGYDATSLNQLKANIGGGITAPSFYAAFGSKEALFREAAERYLATHGKVVDCLWDAGLAPRDAIETALRRSAKMQCERGHPKGCMAALGTVSACAPETVAVLQPLLESQARARAGIAACVKRGIDSGELRADTDTRELATVFDGFLLGLTPLARRGVRHVVLDAAVTRIMGIWDQSAA